MKTFIRIVLLTILGVPLLLLGSCLGIIVTGTQNEQWNQRLTLVIETPQGEVRGSAVTRVTKTETSGSLVLMEARGVRSKIEGEAVVVEIAPGKFLFALLSGSGEEKRDATHWVYPAYRLSEADSYGGEMMKLLSQPHDSPVPLPPEAWPMLVTFDDINKPETVREVNPADLSAVFGEEVRLKAVTLEITEDAVTEGRITKLPFWEELVEQVTFSGLQFADPAKPDPLNYRTWKTLKMPASKD